LISRKSVALMAMIASLYTFLGLYNLGIESIMHPLAIIFGIPCIYGLTIGHLTTAVYHGYGILDIFTPVVIFPAKYLMAKVGAKAYLIHSLVLGFWLPLIYCIYGRFPFASYPLLVCAQFIWELLWEGLGVIIVLKIQKRYRT